MFCTNCGNDIPDTSTFCPKCGQPIEGGDSGNATTAAHAEPEAQSGSRKPVAIAAAIAIAAIVIVAIVAFAVLPKGSPAPSSASSAASSSSSTQSEAPSEASSSASETATDAAAEAQNDDSAALEAALAANPSVVVAGNATSSDPVLLTGVVEVGQGEEVVSNGKEIVDVYMLRLPNPVTVTGTQYMDQSSDLVILNGIDSEIKQQAGKYVTLQMELSVRVTASIASAAYSVIQGSSISLEYVFDSAAAPAASSSQTESVAKADPKDQPQLAHDAAMALFTSGEYANGSFTKTGCTVSNYLAPGSDAAAQYSNGWTDGGDFFAESAEITDQHGNTYDLDVVFNTVRTGEIAERDGDLKVYIAHVTLSFDENNKIATITGKVV